MEYNTHDIDLIELYLEGKLSGDELATFEKNREENPGLQRRVDEMAVIIDCIKSSGRQSLMEELTELEASLPEVDIDEESRNSGHMRAVKGGRSIRKILLWAVEVASAAALLAGCYFGVAEPTIQSQRIPKSQRDETLGSPMINPDKGNRSSVELLSDSDNAFVYYREGNFGKSIGILKNKTVRSEEDWIVLGNSYYAKRRYRKAAECFKPGNFSENSGQLEAAGFWLAKCYIALNDKEKAITILQEIANNGTKFPIEAKKLLTEY